MNILMLTIGFKPNVGGIETHFDDFLKASYKRGVNTTVLTYKPITSKVKAPAFEKGPGYQIIRIKWFSGIFYKLVDKPIVEFLYLLPGLFLFTPVVLLFKRKISVIHAHGLIAGFVGGFWGKVFRKKVIVSTHSIYDFPKTGAYRKFAQRIFGSAEITLCLSDQSVREIVGLGIDSKKVKRFTYWIDLDIFKPKYEVGSSMGKQKIKKELGWGDKFVCLFVGRLVEVKGVEELLKAASKMNQGVVIAVAGDGPLRDEVLKYQKKLKDKIIFLGKVNNSDLATYYNGADVLIVPSIHEEGFGRVILEALACGTPVIGSKRGAIPEAMDETVGKLIDISPETIVQSVNYFSKNPAQLKRLGANARKFAEKKYSEKNIERIIKYFK